MLAGRCIQLLLLTGGVWFFVVRSTNCAVLRAFTALTMAVENYDIFFFAAAAVIVAAVFLFSNDHIHKTHALLSLKMSIAIQSFRSESKNKKIIRS